MTTQEIIHLFVGGLGAFRFRPPPVGLGKVREGLMGRGMEERSLGKWREGGGP